MIKGIGSPGSMSSVQLERLFSRLDTDASGKVSRDEFVAGRPDDVESDAAGALFDVLDNDSQGSLSQSDFASAFQQLASTMQAALIQAQGDGGGREPHGPPPPPEDMMAKLDSDGDGLISESEFVAGRPDDVSEEQATQLYQSIAGDDSDGLTSEQLAQGMGPPPPPPPHDQSQDDLAAQLLSALEESGQSRDETSVQQQAAGYFQEFLKAIQAYSSQTQTSSVGAVVTA